MGSPLQWLAFNVAVLAMLAFDLGALNRGARGITTGRALAMVGITVALSTAFGGWLWLSFGREPALQFATVYVLEYALSVDNLFVFLLVFTYFKVPPPVRHRVLFWGVLGAFVMRATLIVAGTSLTHRFPYLLYGLGIFLLYSAVTLAFSKDEDLDPEKSAILRWSRKILPVAKGDPDGRLLLVREHGHLRLSPLFLVLLVVEGTDLLFAMDSIPAALGVSSDAFIVYTANVCAIVGLRSLFFVVASLMDKFHFLKFGLSVVLAFIGAKMLVEMVHITIPIWLSLVMIALVLAASMAASAIWPERGKG